MYLGLLICFAVGYFLGGIPFALLIGFVKGIDIRKKGSGNIGATNLWRLAGKGPGSLAMLLDILVEGLARPLVDNTYGVERRRRSSYDAKLHRQSIDIALECHIQP